MSAPRSPGGEEVIVADPNVVDAPDDDRDSAYDGDSLRESTASLTSDILDYRNLHGRRFQASKTTEYWGPNDDLQNDGLDITHHWITMCLDDKLTLAPIGDNPQRVLDIGTGTGIWAIDFADEYPSAEVIGTDISPIQPSWTPPNCHFQIDDAQLDWTWPTDHFDYINARTLIGAIDDWPKLYGQALAHLKPGGYFQAIEFDIETRSDTDLVGPDHVFKQWCGLFFRSGERTGRSFAYPVRDGGMEALMRDTGFKEVTHRTWKVPIGGWPADARTKMIGLYSKMFIEQSLEGFALFLFKEVLGWEYAEIQALLGKMRQAIRNQRLMPYFNMHLVYGKKPDKPKEP